MRKFLCLFLSLISIKLSAFEVEVKIDDSQSFSNTEIVSKFGYVSAFYERIIYSFNILESSNKADIRKCSRQIYEAFIQGKKSSFIIKKYDGDNDLVFQFVKMKEPGNSMLCVSNFDSKTKKILTGSFTNSTWALKLNIINGYFIDRRAPEKASASDNNTEYANEMLFDQDITNNSLIEPIISAEISKKSDVFSYIVLAQYYFNENSVNKGLDVLRNNKDEILADKKQKNIEKIYNTTIEEGLSLAGE